MMVVWISPGEPAPHLMRGRHIVNQGPLDFARDKLLPWCRYGCREVRRDGGMNDYGAGPRRLWANRFGE